MNRAVIPLALVFTSGFLVGCGSGDKGGKEPAASAAGPAAEAAGPATGYAQRLLDLDPAKRKEWGINPPKKAKALFAPGSVEDFIQSLTLFEFHPGSDLACYDTNTRVNKTGMDVARINEVNGIRYDYQVQIPGGVTMPQACWDALYGPRKDVKAVEESSGPDKRFGGGSLVAMSHWTMACTDETLLVRGADLQKTPAGRAKPDRLKVEFVHFNKRFESICPKPKELTRGVSFKY